MLRVDNRTVSDKTEIAEALAEMYRKNSCSFHFDELFRAKEHNQEAVEIPIIIDYEDSLNMPISKKEYEDALPNFNNASHDPDEIPVISIRNLPVDAHELRMRIYNIIWTDHRFPSA
ncbi:hypothetical protein JTB14_006349 [Gonioctena quinquepunctata]|nr:hypothetical protein JTB14_006349 [Gonioctena quinquepunctata]